MDFHYYHYKRNKDSFGEILSKTKIGLDSTFEDNGLLKNIDFLALGSFLNEKLIVDLIKKKDR